jgi:TolB-like protein
MSDPKPPRVFLSYSRPDRAWVARLVEALDAAGISVWWDSAIEGGASFSAEIERELDAADVVIVAWSASAVKSTWVRDEAGAGRDRGRLVPVQIDATMPPLGFRQFQAIDLSAWKGRADDPNFASLVSAIQRLAGAEVAVPVPKAAPATTGPNRRLLIGGAAGAAALAAGCFGAWKSMGGGKVDDGTASVVVLPFANLSGDPEQAFFSDGIAEELRNALSQIRGLKVIGRVSSEAFRDTSDLPAAAAKLGVDHVLTGSVRRSPTTIRISAQLVDGRSGVESWSASYDQPVGDALAIQSKIATNVLAALSGKLAKAAGTIVVGGTANPQAQELLLKAGKIFYNTYSVSGYSEAQRLLEAVITIDPACAVAWAGVSYTKTNLADFSASATEREDLKRAALAASQRGVSLAPNSGFARQALAFQYMQSLNMRRALAEGERAIVMSPAEPAVVFGFTRLLLLFDPDRALETVRNVASIDPFNPYYFSTLANCLIAARRYREAADAAQQASILSKNNIVGGGLQVVALLALGRIQAARALLPTVVPEHARFAFTAIVEARAGNRAASDFALMQLRSKSYDSINSFLAIVHAQRGEPVAALAALETAIEFKEVGVVRIAFDPSLDPIRNEPRFKAVQDAVIPPDLFVRPKRWVA